jgi:ureidoglycolate lyase
MKTVPVEPLTPENFREFGCFRDLLNPMSERLGAPPIEFFPDMIQQMLGSSQSVSYSNCRIGPREPVINVAECHSSTAEMLMPLDADVLMFFDAGSVSDEEFPSDRVRVFLVPKGTMVVVKPGVWHHGPFCVGTKVANILVALPERTYANDTRTVVLEGDDCLLIASPSSPRAIR